VAVKAYILIETAPGQVAQALQGVRNVCGVTAADAVTGPYDLIAVAEADDLKTLGETVVNKIQAVAGVERTLTSVTVEL